MKRLTQLNEDVAATLIVKSEVKIHNKELCRSGSLGLLPPGAVHHHGGVLQRDAVRRQALVVPPSHVRLGGQDLNTEKDYEAVKL